MQAVDTRRRNSNGATSQAEASMIYHGLAYQSTVEFNHILPPIAWVTPTHRNMFIHEIGHLFGCGHNIEQHLKEGGQLTTGNNNYGYYLEGTNAATIMAYRTLTHPVWIPYFSSKDIVLYGVPLGDEMHDNRKQIMKTRFAVAQYGDESGNCKNRK